jgi:hypothetical protein
MKLRAYFFSVALALAVGDLASAQTLFAPGGSLGSSSTSGVGIGTSSPQTKLHVYSTSLDNGALLKSETSQGSGTNVGLWMTGGAPNANWFIGTNRGDLAAAADSLLFYKVVGNAGPKMVLTDGGFLGVGTNAPAYKVHVADASNQVSISVGHPELSTTTATGYRLASWNDGNVYEDIKLGFGGALIYRYGQATEESSATTWMVMRSGALGLGTANPTAALEISKASTPLALSYGPEPAVYNLKINQVVTSSVVRWSFDQRNANNDYPNTLVFDRGNVGIGTTNPTQKLSVNGTIRAKEVIVDTNWADYVFEPNYRLAPLNEVESAIKQDGHLPGVPSAREIAERGVSVGEMQAKLLEKMEEMTLHLISHEKELAALRRENAELRQTLSKLSTHAGL